MSPQDVILLVEDNEDDVILLHRAFLRARVLNPLLVVKDGEEAIYYLEGSGRYANRMEFPLPSVVLLDLKLPGIGGFDLLRWVRKQPGLRNLRVVVLTSSDRISDVNQAYQLGASSFLVKPADLDSLIQIMAAFRGQWLWLKTPPEVSGGGWPRKDNDLKVRP
jgi:CheY-like chemotaxis protein